MKILITGACGFIGKHLCRHLAAERHEVAAFDLQMGNNILDACAVEAAVAADIDVVYHLAGQSDLTKISNIGSSYHAIELNVNGTHQLAHACTKYGVWMIYASTTCVYGNQKTFPSTEDTTRPNPVELYAFTKLAGEEIVRGYGANHGLQHTIVRFSTAYGPGMRETLAPFIFLHQATQGSDITVHGTGEQTRSTLYITDLVAGLAAVKESSKAKAQIINLSGSEPISAVKMARDIRRLLNSDSTIVHVADRLNQIAQEDCSTAKALDLLEWKPTITWTEGLRRTAEWFKTSIANDRENSGG